MSPSVEILLKKMNEDSAFAEMILSQTEEEDVIRLAKGEGIEITPMDIAEVNDLLAKAVQQKNDGELSEEELEGVAGGLFNNSMLSVSGISINVSAKVQYSLIRISKQWDRLINGPDDTYPGDGD